MRITNFTEGPLVLREEDEQAFHLAYTKFFELAMAANRKHEFAFKAGDLYIFNNRRMLHGRTEIEIGDGERHLEGCYVNIDDFRSKSIYYHALRGIKIAPRVGNDDYF